MSIVTNGLVGYWNSKQGVSGNTWNNIAPAMIGQYNATINGATINQNGMHYDGIDDYVDIPVPDAFKVVTNATFECRLMLQNNADYPEFLSANNDFLLYAYDNGSLADCGIFSASWSDYISALPNVLKSESYISITANVTTGQIKYYIDGLPIRTETRSIGLFTNSNLSSSSATTFRLGSYFNFPPLGIIDNVRLYNRTLTDAEIAQNYAVGAEVGLSSGTAHTKILNETVALSENITKRLSSFKSFSDSITTNDTMAKRLSVIVADTITTSENENENTNKTVSDSLTLADTYSNAARRIINDFIPINDNISISNSNTRSINLNDSIAILDSISKQLSRNISDNVDLVETENGSMFKSLVDNIALSDSISTFGGKTILLTESITITDSISTTKQLSRLFTESINLSDSYTKQSAQSIKLYDVIVTSDSVDIFNPDAPNLIGVIHLRGKRELFVYLQGKRELTINLQGKRELFINLRGGVKMVPNQNFSMISGDTTTLVININENLVGASVKWAMKKRESSIADLSKNGSIVDGKIHIVLDKEDTEGLIGMFIHECEVTDQSGNVSTVTSGSVNILADMI